MKIRKKCVSIMLILFLISIIRISTMEKCSTEKKIKFGQNKELSFFKGKEFIKSIQKNENKVNISIGDSNIQFDYDGTCTIRGIKGLLTDYSNFPADIVNLISTYTEEYNTKVLFIRPNYLEILVENKSSQAIKRTEEIFTTEVFSLNSGTDVFLIKKISSNGKCVLFNLSQIRYSTIKD